LLIPNKICRDCKYFIGDELECGKFGDTNIITGKVIYPYAKTMREDEKACGKAAIHFEENKFKIITVPYYLTREYFPLPILGFAFTVYVFAGSYFLSHK